MDRKQLKTWVRAWAGMYPAGADEVLVPLAGVSPIDRDATAIIVNWKFNNMAHRRANAHRGLAKEPDGRIEDLTARAFGCNDELGALLIIDSLQGVGPALGTSILMAANPERYTVMDTRSIQSIRAHELPGARFDDANEREWLDYLASCRSISERAAESLRTVDRALFMADGRLGLPS